jgi:hypothetical protein
VKKLAPKTVHISAILPAELHARLIRQVSKETSDRGHTITPSKLIRWAVEDYLDQWETATLVPDPAQPKEN